MEMSPAAEDPLVVERRLVDRARVDPDAFSELYRNYLDRVHAYAWRRTGSREAAEDICAATFEAAYRGLGRFRWRSGGFAPWLFRIASNEVVPVAATWPAIPAISSTPPRKWITA